MSENINEIFQEGWLTKEGRVVKNWKRRYFVLRGGRLLYYKNMTKHSDDLKGQVPLANSTVRAIGLAESLPTPVVPMSPAAPDGMPSEDDVASFKWRFSVESDGRVLLMAAQSESDMQDWIRSILNAINVENYIIKCQERGTEPLSSVTTALADPRSDTVHVKREAVALDGLRCLVQAVSRSPSFTCLKLTECGLTDGFMPVLAQAIASNKTLAVLDLSGNRIGSDGLSDLADGLYINISIHAIHLSGNSIGDFGAAPLSDLLRANTTITTIDLSQNGIGSIGAGHISKALSSNQTLEVLIMSENPIGDEGAAVLAPGLAETKSLRKISLSKNSIGPQGIVRLCEGLLHNKTLHEIDLSGNEMSQVAANALVGVLENHKVLSRVNLGACKHLDTKGVETLAEVLKSRFSVSKLQLKRTSGATTSVGRM